MLLQQPNFINSIKILMVANITIKIQVKRRPKKEMSKQHGI